MKKNRMKNALVCGMLGCLCYGGGDWLMLYGNPAHHGTLLWLTEGVAKIAQWRFNLAMALAFPGILLYGIALHLFYIMILTLFAWLNRNGFADDATAICEGLYAPLSWLVPVSEALMVPVFVWWFWLQISGKTIFPRWMAFTNVLIIFGVLKSVSLLIPVSAFRLGFTNGLMSESMIVWFGFMLWKGASGYERITD